MKKWALLTFIVLMAFFVFARKSQVVNKSPSAKSNTFASQGPTQNKQDSVFVPYWTMDGGEIQGNYDTLIYFGLAVNENGIERMGPGFSDIAKFINKAGNRKKTLVIAMTDSSLNGQILRSDLVKQRIIQDSISIAKANGFDAVMLDLESSSIAFDSVVERINNFSDEFFNAAHSQHLSYDVALFGDTYFRARPYNVKDIALHSDRIYVMAYDFHKSRGNPGPNFPLNGKSIYGYDFKSMVDDFKSDVRPDKLVIVFGMFGYDWPVDSKGEATASGISISYNLAKQNLLSNCKYNLCRYKRDDVSSEMMVSYEKDGQKHIVWFDDPASVKDKIDYLKNEGISSDSYWAYSYF